MNDFGLHDLFFLIKTRNLILFNLKSMRINNPNFTLSENSKYILVLGEIKTNDYVFKRFVNFDST